MSKRFFERNPIAVPGAIAAVMLVGALAEWPYVYYTFLRIVTCGVAVVTAGFAYEQKRIAVTWLFGFIAVLFNPIVPVHLTREIWAPIDLLTAVLFVVAIFIVREPKEDQPPDRLTEDEE